VISPRLTMVVPPAVVAFRIRDTTDMAIRQTRPSRT
jgi:hypothetical protein